MSLGINSPADDGSSARYVSNKSFNFNANAPENHLDESPVPKTRSQSLLNDVPSDFSHNQPLAPVAYLQEKTHHIPLANQIYLKKQTKPDSENGRYFLGASHFCKYPSSVTLRNTKQQESQTIHQEKKVEIDSWHELNRENRAIKKD